MPILRTPRLILHPGTVESLRAELVSNVELGKTINARIPESWPPELYDEDAINWTIRGLDGHPENADWSLYYVLLPEDESEMPTLIGGGGFKGAPDTTGTVEVGYGILSAYRRRGYAREAVLGWMAFAFAEKRVNRVIAHTLTELLPSQRVLDTSGFRFVGKGNDPSEPDAIQYEMTRAMYEGSEKAFDNRGNDATLAR